VLALIVLLQALSLAISGPPTSAEYLPIWVAAADGHFARQGLRVTLKTTRSEVGAAEALAQSQADLAATSVEALLRFGMRDGQNPRLVLGLTAAPPVALIVDGQRAARVRSVADLAGQRVGLTAPGAAEHAWLTLLLARAGLTAAQVHLIGVGTRGIERALMSGDVHAVLAPEPAATQILTERRAVVLGDLRTPVAARQALGMSTVSAAVFVRAERRPGERELAAFTRAILAAEDRLANGVTGDLDTKLPESVLGNEPDELDLRVHQARTLYLPDGRVTAQQLDATVGFLRDHLPLSARGRLQILPLGRVKTTR
jgi:sulfonate transport system substrate-binding protein